MCSRCWIWPWTIRQTGQAVTDGHQFRFRASETSQHCRIFHVCTSLKRLYTLGQIVSCITIVSVDHGAFNLRLAIHLLLHSEFEAAVAVLAVVCSSMVPVNRGSTDRSFMTPLGNEYFLAVRKSNKLTSRIPYAKPVWFAMNCFLKLLWIRY